MLNHSNLQAPHLPGAGMYNVSHNLHVSQQLQCTQYSGTGSWDSCCLHVLPASGLMQHQDANTAARAGTSNVQYSCSLVQATAAWCVVAEIAKGAHGEGQNQSDLQVRSGDMSGADRGPPFAVSHLCLPGCSINAISAAGMLAGGLYLSFLVEPQVVHCSKCLNSVGVSVEGVGTPVYKTSLKATHSSLVIGGEEPSG